MQQDPQPSDAARAPRVLVAESNDAVRSAWETHFLARCGPMVFLDATCGRDAVRLLLDERPDLVVVSLRLPEGAMANPQGGFQVILDAADLGVPAVLVCGRLDDALCRRLDHLGVLCVRRDQAAIDVASAAFEALRRYAESPSSARHAAPSRSARSAIAS
jgi:DNA-binding NarL/FixJ family response regulator